MEKEIHDLVLTRRSVHSYTDEPIDDETLRNIFEDVRWSPSSYNLQPWEFVVVRDDARKERLREHAYGQEHVTDAAAVVVVFGNLDRGAHARSVFDDQARKGYRDDESARELAERFEDEPPDGNEEWALQSATIAATTLMYAAWARGIASCPMGGWDGDALADEFDAPPHWYPVLMVTLGYPDKESDEWGRDRKMRRSPEDFVHYERIEDIESGEE